MLPRWSGRSGCRSTVGGGSPSFRRDRVMAATHPREPAAVVRVPVREAHGFDGPEPDAEPTRVLQPDLGGGSDVEEDRALFGPRRPVTSAEKPWQARHRCPQGSTQSWPSLGARWGTRATSRPSSGSCGTPSSTLDSMSLSLSTTTSRSSASSAAISTGFIALSCRLATLAAPGSGARCSVTAASIWRAFRC